MMRSPAEQLGAVDGGGGVFGLELELFELVAEVLERFAEGGEAFLSFVFLGLVEFGGAEGGVLVEGSREGC
jgi:hypothetical protein